MYDNRPNLLLGFHGCDKATRNALVNNPHDIKVSNKPYDWLGHGFYFWENNYERAMDWANEKAKRGRIQEPAVLGAVIDLGYCFDLLDSKYTKMLRESYDYLTNEYKKNDKDLHKNTDAAGDIHNDKVFRNLDCRVIQDMHSLTYKKSLKGRDSNVLPIRRIFDSTRGVFIEGGPVFEGSEIREKSHIQICIRNFNCIKGFFVPREEYDFDAWQHDYYQNEIEYTPV